MIAFSQWTLAAVYLAVCSGYFYCSIFVELLDCISQSSAKRTPQPGHE